MKGRENGMYELHEVARLADISERTLRRYIKKYKLRIGRGSFNKYSFCDEDVKKLILLRTMIKDGYNDEEIIEAMECGQDTVTHELLPAPQVSLLNELSQAIRKQDRKTGKVLESMTRELKTYELLLRQQLKQQAMLMRKLVSLEKQVQKSFWQKLFGFFSGVRADESPLCNQCGTPNSKLNAFCIGCGTPYLAQPQVCSG